MADIEEEIQHSVTLRPQRTWAKQASLPFIDCAVTDSISYDLDCSCMNDEDFFYPVNESDVWDFQTNFLDDTNVGENVVAGWNDGGGNFLYELQFENCSGSVLTGIIQQYASDWLVGYTGKGYIQTARVDFASFWGQLEDIFAPRIKIQTIAGVFIRFHYFPTMIKNNGCNGTVELRSIVDSFDCENRYYRTPEFFVGNGSFAFINFRRIFGVLELSSFDIITDQTDAGEIVNKDIDSNSQFRTSGLPDTVVKEIVAIMGGIDVSIDGEVFDIMPTIEKNNDDSNMWYIDAIVKKRICSIGKTCEE